jgi:hypothetical protein
MLEQMGSGKTNPNAKAESPTAKATVKETPNAFGAKPLFEFLNYCTTDVSTIELSINPIACLLSNIKNLEQTQNTPAFLTVSCILHTFCLSRHNVRRKTRSNNDLPCFPSVALAKEGQKYSRLMGGQIPAEMSCLKTKEQFYNRVVQAVALRLRPRSSRVKNVGFLFTNGATMNNISREE